MSFKLPGKLAYPLGVALLSSLLATLAVSYVSWLGYLELRVHQQRLVHTGDVKPNPEIVVVTIEDDTPVRLKLVSHALPLPRRFHAILIRALKQAGARALVLDLIFPNSTLPEDDEALRQSLNESAPLPIALAAISVASERDPDCPTGWRNTFAPPAVLPQPLRHNVQVASPVVFNPNNMLDGAVLLMPNAATGRALPYLAFSAALARLEEDVTQARWDKERGLVTAGRFCCPVGQDGELHVRWTKGAFRRIEYAKALEMLRDPDGRKAFRDKIVVVGTAVANDDIHATPIGQIHGVMFVAQVLNTLMLPEMALVTRWRIPANAVWSCLLALAVGLAIGTLRPRTVVPGLIACLAMAFWLPSLGLARWHVWIDTVGPVLAILLASVFSALLAGTRSSSLAQRFVPRFAREQRPTSLTEEATVLFVDLSQSTSIASQIGPVAAQQFQSDLLRGMSRAVTHHGGEVERTLGDGLMAVFRSKGDWKHALNCVHAAAAIEEAAEPILARLRDEHGIDTNVNIGIESGIISGSVVHAADREEWSSFGPTVNLAARLQGACADMGATPLLGPVTNSLVQHEIQTSFVAAVSLKGIEGQTTLYTVREN